MGKKRQAAMNKYIPELDSRAFAIAAIAVTGSAVLPRKNDHKTWAKNNSMKPHKKT